LAQQTEEASADAQAGAQADTAAADANVQADTQPAANESSSDQSNAQPATADNSTQDSTSGQASPPAHDSQSAANDQQDAAATTDATNEQPAQGTGPALPPPANAQDANAAQQQREQSRVVEGQQLQQKRGATDRDRDGASAQGRINAQARTGRDRDADLRTGIQFGRATDRGLTVSRLDRNSFFFNSGIRQGDVIVSVHGRPIRNDADFMRFIILQPGQRVPVVVWRDGRRETIYVVYRDMAVDRRIYDSRQFPAHPSPSSGGAYLGVIFEPEARDMVVIRSVNPGSPAQEAGLQPGDIILALNGQEVRTYPEVISIVRAMRPGDQLDIAVERSRNERQMVAVLDAPPNVRTAVRPTDRNVERTSGTYPPDDVRIDVNRTREDDRFDDRDSDNDRSRSRGLLPRFRN
jgi:C-terminal processing protease CtpA/Prc